MRGLEHLKGPIIEEECKSREEEQEERLAEAREEKELFLGAMERREQLDQEEIPLELQSRPRTIVMEQTI